MMNYLRKPLDLNLALLLKLLHIAGHADVCGQIEHRCGCQLGIDDRFAIRHRARERVPTGGDVIANWIETRRGGGLLRATWCRRGGETNRESANLCASTDPREKG